MDRLATVRHLIESSEHPVQAMTRVLDFLRVEFPSLLWAGIYLVTERRLEPGPWCGTQGDGKTGGRELALRAAFTGMIQQEGALLAVPITSQAEVRAILALRSEQPARGSSAELQGFLNQVATLLAPLV